MQVAILGSEGQIRAYLSEYLTKKGHELTGVDVVYGPENALRVTPHTYFESKIENADFVFFLAFDVGGSRYLKKYQNTFELNNNNTRMMANTFRLLNKYKTPFVFASSQMSNMSYSPYGVMKRVGELYTKALGGLIVKFWNVYGIEKDHEKAHVITDFIRKGFETGVIDMWTDGTEQREFWYAEDCCEALETVMEQYTEHNSDSELHIISFQSTTILEIGKIIQGSFKSPGKKITLNPAQAKDDVQKDARNEANPHIKKWWKPKTSIEDGIEKIFEEMKKDY